MDSPPSLSRPPRPRPPRGLTAATRADIAALTLRPEHEAEVREVGGVDGSAALAGSLAQSVETYCWRGRDGLPAFVIGVGPRGAVTGGATVWMLGSAAMDAAPLAVAKAALWGIDRAFAVTNASYLEQTLPRWYRTGRRFVRWLGFREHRHGEVVLVRLDVERWRARRRRGTTEQQEESSWER